MPDPADVIATLHIRYQRGDDEPTERDVSIMDFDPHSISGHCHLRSQYRTFRIFDIRECYDTSTGEVVEKQNLSAYLYTLYQKTSRYTLERLMTPELPVLEILVFIARVDGQIRAAERKVIATACKVFTHDLRITESQASDAMNRTAALSLHSFKVAVGRINKLGDEAVKRKLLAATRTIIDTQKNVTPGEKEALDYMTKRFSKPV
ncbi:hypothetical protein D9M68_734220 [compost metagenome]